MLAHGKIDGVRYNNKAGEDFRENARAIISGDYFAIVSRKSDGRWKIDAHYKDKKTEGTIKVLSNKKKGSHPGAHTRAMECDRLVAAYCAEDFMGSKLPRASFTQEHE